MSEVQTLVDQLTAAIRKEARTEIAAELTNGSAAGAARHAVPAKRRGRPPGSKNGVVKAKPAKKSAASAERYRCPVPRCKNAAAPRFGMVCKKHKDLPKAQITKFREARKAKRAGK